jgi:ribosomal-protein-alanine N-acetyltransferase
VSALSEPNVHVAREEDLGAVATLDRQHGSAPWSLEALRDAWAHERHRLWVARDRAAMAGFLLAGDMVDQVEVLGVVVDPTRRRCGHGARLIQAAAAWALARGCERLALEVHAENQPAISLYERLGFRLEAVRKGYYQHPPGDAWLMVVPPGELLPRTQGEGGAP